MSTKSRSDVDEVTIQSTGSRDHGRGGGVKSKNEYIWVDGKYDKRQIPIESS